MLLGDITLFGIVLIRYELKLLGDVSWTEIENAIGGKAVSSRSTGFLVVAFDILGQVLVNDVANIRFVDAHAEGNCGADDLDLVADERFLVFRPLKWSHACVIGKGFDAALAQPISQGLGSLARIAIDDAAFEGLALNKAQDLLEDGLLGLDAISEIGPVKACDEGLGILQAELVEDVAADALGGRCSKGHERQVGKEASQVGELPVLGSKIVSPFAYAVGFVDGETGDVPLLEIIQKSGEHESLWSHVENGVLACEELGVAFAGFGLVERRVEISRVDPIRFQTIDLVFHQRDERRYDDSKAFAYDSGQLVTQGFPATGRQESEDVFAVERFFDDFLLQGTERVVAEVALESSSSAIHGSSGRHVSKSGLRRVKSEERICVRHGWRPVLGIEFGLPRMGLHARRGATRIRYMNFVLRIGLFAGAMGLLSMAWGDVDASRTALYEAARDVEKSFDDAYAAAKDAGVVEAFLIEAQILNYLSTGNMAKLYGSMDQLESVADGLEYGMDKTFHSKKQLIGMAASIRAIQAYEAGNIPEFEKQAAKSYLNSPEYNEAFGLMRLMTEVRQKEVQEEAMANLRIPMDMQITSADGETRALNDWLSGNQAMLIDFWASWCGPCIQLMPELKAKADKLPDQGVFVAGMNTDADDPVGKAKKTREQHNMQSVPWLLEPADRPLSQLLMINSIPRMVLVAPDGKVLYNGHPMDPALGTALAKLDVKL